MIRQFITVRETAHADIESIVRLARQPVPTAEYAHQHVSLVFERPSLRTRASSITSVQQLGGHVAVFTDAEIGLDTRESAEDVARTLAQTSDVIAARVKDHDVFDRMIEATKGSVSFINLLSNVEHPAQAVADLMTLVDHLAGGDVTQLQGRTVAYVGDATNVTRSLALILAGFGVTVRVAAPTGYQLLESDYNDFVGRARFGASLELVSSPVDAVRGADAVYTDAWISMGLEDEAAERRRIFAPYQINEELMSHAPNAYVLHCLPAHRGEEITDGVLDSPRSVVWTQVRHRTSAMLGVLRWLKEQS